MSDQSQITAASSTFGASPRAIKREARGFTLVELLVVMCVIVVLVSILLPALSSARTAANVVTCQAHERQLMAGFLLFAADHNNCLPGNYWDSQYQQPADPSKRDWLIGNNPNQGNEALQVLDAPQKGTIYPYINDMPVYLCPAYASGWLNAGGGSNGRFDYAAFIVFSGAHVNHVKTNAQFQYNGVTDTSVFTPIICEEEPNGGGFNNGNDEGGHCNSDRLGHYHRGGGHYASIDGSVHWYLEPLNASSWNWSSLAPSGQYVTLGSVPIPGWGFWDHQ